MGEEDFEFKPLTNGLGFHKKSSAAETELQSPAKTEFRSLFSKSSDLDVKPNSKVSADHLSRLIEKFPALADPIISNLTDGPESRNPTFQNLRIRKSSPQSETEIKFPILSDKEINESKQDEILQTPDNMVRNFVSREPLAPILEEVPFSFAAFVFDAVVILALNCLFTGVVLAVTHADLLAVIENAKSDIPTRISLVLLVISVAQFYMVLSRSFFGRTIGEWTFDLQLGNSIQQKSWWYPIGVGWRSLLTMATGFFILPLLSILAGRDISAFPSGLRVYRFK